MQGAISVFLQMAMYDGNHTYRGKPLFRGAIMNSGSITPTDPVDCPKGQRVYDTVLHNAGCGNSAAAAADNDDYNSSLDCLRGLDTETLLDALNSVPSFVGYYSVSLSYLPRPDGVVLTDSPDVLAREGRYAAVPFIIGDQEDEGTAFSLFQWNLTTSDDLVDYLSSIFFHDAPSDLLRALVSTYPDDPAAGSPFRTADYNWYGQYKRLAAVLGDLVFTLARRLFLHYALEARPDVPSWSYLASYGWGTPVLGTYHSSDIAQVFQGVPPLPVASWIRSYYISFVYTGDPNNGSAGLDFWPQWKNGRQLMNFELIDTKLIPDSFRSQSYDFLAANADFFHL